MSKKSGIKKLISAALMATSLSAAGAQLPVSAVESNQATSETSNASALWTYMNDGKNLPDEPSADALISSDADEIWRASCEAALEGAGAKKRTIC